MGKNNIEVFLALGSNLGDKLENLKAAEGLLKENGIKIINRSKVYVTEPYGYKEQDDFLNECVLVSTSLEPLELLSLINLIEKRLKRERIIHWGPRTIDIDILFYGNEIVDLPNLKIPHPEIQFRDFVLRPLMDINPNLVHPVLNLSVKDMYSKIEDNCKLLKETRRLRGNKFKI